MSLLWIVGSTLLVSLLAFAGIITLSMKKRLNDIVVFLVALSAGALVGGAFFHLIPEALAGVSEIDMMLAFVIAGFVSFFLVEKLLHWRHCHKVGCKIHTFGYMNLVGDSIHNFIDGLVLAASYMSSIELGITTTIAIASHEIPQEIGDFGVLLHSGFKKRKAILTNFAVACVVVLGGVVGFLLSSSIESFVPFLLPIAAGGFIYIASSDLIPELRKVNDSKKSAATFIVFLAGLALMWTVKYVFA